MNDDASSALIGYTGFVGSNLLRQRTFDACFNSSNIDQINGRSFDLVVGCGARAEKWKANADPAADLDNIELTGALLSNVNATGSSSSRRSTSSLNPVGGRGFADADDRAPRLWTQPAVG
jgi:hypothetical protein